ncbi:hypothetical protein BN1200_330024 [Klebsiella variicola]|nr:hypothetical protein BN1200_330024 [Klebsiella variicola]CTQ25261.1 hypothetical protein BN1200_710076 [Klebsiella variicola]
MSVVMGLSTGPQALPAGRGCHGIIS